MKKRVLSVLIVLTLAFIWGNSLLPGETSLRLSDGVMNGLNKAAAAVGLKEDIFTTMLDTEGSGVPEPTSYGIRKAAHLTEFALLAALIRLRLDGGGFRRTALVWCLSVLSAAADETIQIFSHRGAMITDVLIDSAGAALGILIVCAAARISRRQKIGGDKENE